MKNKTFVSYKKHNKSSTPYWCAYRWDGTVYGHTALCDEVGSPLKFTTKEEAKKALRRRNMTIGEYLALKRKG